MAESIRRRPWLSDIPNAHKTDISVGFNRLGFLAGRNRTEEVPVGSWIEVGTSMGTTFPGANFSVVIDSQRHQPVQRTIGSTAHIRRDREGIAASSRTARLWEA